MCGPVWILQLEVQDVKEAYSPLYFRIYGLGIRVEGLG